SRVATTTWRVAMPPLVMNTFWPFSTQSSPSRTARVRRLETSDPAPGSVTATRPTLGSAGGADGRSGDRERADVGLGRGAEQLRGPAGDLVGGAAGDQGAQGQAAAEDAE